MTKFLRRFLYVLIPILILYGLFVMIAPPILIADKNAVSDQGLTPSQEAINILQGADFVGDLHCDALLWRRDLTERTDMGHVDFPRMREGNVAFQAFTIVTKSPAGQNFHKNSGDSFDMITALSIGQGQSISTWFSLINRAVYQCKKLHAFAKADNDNFIVIKSKGDMKDLLQRRKTDRNVIGGLLGIEGAHCLEGKISNIHRIHEAGVRMLGPAHFFDNEMGGSAHGMEAGGLTPFGEEVLMEMQKRNMIMDLAHSSEKVIDQIFQKYKGPILTSHTGVKGTYDSSRNLSDAHLKAIADRDGLIGIAYFAGATGDGSIRSIVDAMRYTRDLIGIDYVALGSDFDGSVTTPFDTTGLALLVDEMLRQGFTAIEINAVLGGNLKRFLLNNL